MGKHDDHATPIWQGRFDGALRPRRGPLVALTLLPLLLVLTACQEPTLVTDFLVYTEGESGVASLLNPNPYEIYLEGCNAYHYEKQVGEEWVVQPPDFACVWEGYARPIEADTTLPLDFTARDPGFWRLWVGIGTGCDPQQPLSEENCHRVSDLRSNVFEVVPDDPNCQPTGCSAQLCADRPIATTCEWLPHYACYRAARCGAFDHSTDDQSTDPPSCGWEQTPELLRCLRESGMPVDAAIGDQAIEDGAVE